MGSLSQAKAPASTYSITEWVGNGKALFGFWIEIISQFGNLTRIAVMYGRVVGRALRGVARLKQKPQARA